MTHDMPIATLTSGLIVANFSSPHSFQFTDGTELGACSAERANASKLEAVEVEIDRVLWTDIDLNFRLNAEVLSMLMTAFEAWKAGEVHIVIVPFPVISAMKATPSLLEFDPNDGGAHPFRTIRTADRVTKVNFAHRFCL